MVKPTMEDAMAMPTESYFKGHRIIRTAAFTHAESGKLLYEIEGRFAKRAAERPLITSRADARQWVLEQLADAEAR